MEVPPVRLTLEVHGQGRMSTHQGGRCMGLLDNIRGTASEVDSADVEQDLQTVFAPGESVSRAYATPRPSG